MYKNKIKKFRKQRQMKLKELAEKAGISIGYLSHLENGSRANPSREVMESISVALFKSIPEVFFEE